MMATIITVMVVGGLIIFAANNFRNMDDKTEIDMIAREYILKMETTGYLTSEYQADLLDELNEYNWANVSIDGTTTSQVNYGDTIILHISGDLNVKTYSLADFFKLKKGDATVSIDISKASTAKY